MTRPNIVVILVDQQHFGMLSCAGNPWVHTPNLDRLAATGIRFGKTYVTNPVCVPSRFSMQTGRMPGEAGVFTNRAGWDMTPEAAQAWTRRGTIASLLKTADYETAYAGKVHFVDGLRPADMGYDLFDRGDGRQETAEWCARYLRTPKSRPFLLFASLINPHDIYRYGVNAKRRAANEPPADDAATRLVDSMIAEALAGTDPDRFIEEHCPPLPDNFAPTVNESEYEYRLNLRHAQRYTPQADWTTRDWRLRRWLYARLTERMDAEVGVITSVLREAGLERETLVIFTSDHGEMDGAHGRAEKRHTYEPSVRVPFIAAKPGAIAPGLLDERHLVSNGLDLLPTLCDYAGIAPPQGLQGLSLRPLMEGRATDWRTHVATESEDCRMIRTRRHKYCAYRGGVRREMLLDLDEDPGETRNLADAPEYRHVLAEHRALMAEWLARTGDREAGVYTLGPGGSPTPA